MPDDNCALVIEPLEMPFGLWSVDSDGPKEARVTWGAHWRHLANRTEPSVPRCRDLFLSSYFDHLFWTVSPSSCHQNDASINSYLTYILENAVPRPWSQESTNLESINFNT